MVNKQSQSQAAQHTQENQEEETNPLIGESINSEFLLRGWNMALEVVNEAVQHNIKSGVRWPERFTSTFFDHMEPMEIRKIKNFIKACFNVKTQTPYTLDMLENANVISSEERSLFGDLSLPRRELVSMYRIQAPNKVEYLSRVERLFGLNKSAGIVTMAFEPDYTKRITVDRMYVDKDPENRGGGGEQVLVKVVGDSNQWIQAEKIWLTLFNPSTVSQALKNTIPNSDKSSRGISFALIREGSPHVIGPQPEDRNLESFVNKPFDELYEKAFKPASTNVTNINVDPEMFKRFLKYQADHEGKDNQYQ